MSSGDAIDLRFPGQWFQAESGLHQNWMRDYDPTTGRYMQADPLGLVDGASVYGYALQSPMRWTDPTGEAVFLPFVVAAAKGAAAGAVTGVATGWAIDQLFGDGCYTWSEAGRDAAFGAVGWAAFKGVSTAWRAWRGAKNLRYGPLNPGPLSDNIASTFRSASYSAVTTSGPTTLYRVYGGKAGQIGGFWTRTRPSGPLQSQLDSALVAAWGNTGSKVAIATVPRGTVIYEGAAASQALKIGNAKIGELIGGGSQVYILRVNPKWIR
ncbi:putative deoxyribonuclease RhsC [Jannaschia aquimarina]|uniref:RhsC_1 protein n=1 Tax=Jannaschia aquimarina TaxID=935700 RepID=A0A0D1DD23_9RHOB|nr:putative deoxyribonuclease RhsC [Jannaschia aquimarina]SNT31446.1 RHS repeat-associated core domain-containing protein [Jannaschia aquimarina]